MRRRLLGRFAINEQLEEEFDRSGLLDLTFSERSDATRVVLLTSA